MERIAHFEKVSFEQFKDDFVKLYREAKRPKDDDTDLSDDAIEKIYESVRIPERATVMSAGYDFVVPIGAILRTEDSVVFPTGIRVSIDSGWCLKCYPRSGLGFKYGVALANSVGIIDGDYYNSTNEGHIMIKLVNHGHQKVTINAGDKVAQGVFVQYGITDDDHADGVRNGGFGSTGR